VDNFPAVTDLIPQRDPMLMVDDILSLATQRAVTRTTFSADRDFYAGYYPGNPITPGMFLCECVHQTAAVLIAHRGARSDGTPVLTRVYGTKFRAGVPPGSTVETEVELTGRAGGVYFCTGRVRLGGEVVLEHRCALGLRRAGTLVMDTPELGRVAR
jgi:3-hydroxyacyl-[acyl-carrier-protein] dehydratase